VKPGRQRKALLTAAIAIAGLLVLAPAASARKPIISYLDGQEKFQLFDAELGSTLSPAPPVPVPAGGAAQFRWGMSLDARYVVFTDANKKLHLLDRSSNQQVSLPGIDKVANPANLTVSNTGVIAFDDNSNKPTYVYDSVAKKFVDTGLGDADPSNPTNVQRQPRLSGDGKFMAMTCFDDMGTTCFTTNDSDSDVFLQNVAGKQQVPNFPDEAMGAGKDEEHPCINNDGTLIAVEKPNPAQKDILLFQRNGNAFTQLTTPNLNDPANDDRFCQLSPGGAYLSVIQNDVFKLYERSSNSFVNLPNLAFDSRSTLSVPPAAAPWVTNCAGKGATEVGTDGRDVIKGTRKRDVIATLGGNDVVRSLGGNDLVCGGKGKDKMLGGKGKDVLRGDAGKDKLFGGKGKDRLKGGAGKDRLIGGPDRDRLNGGPGKDEQIQ
jgi:hemolysin type calcium-binding protein